MQSRRGQIKSNGSLWLWKRRKQSGGPRYDEHRGRVQRSCKGSANMRQALQMACLPLLKASRKGKQQVSILFSCHSYSQSFYQHISQLRNCLAACWTNVKGCSRLLKSQYTNILQLAHLCGVVFLLTPWFTPHLTLLLHQLEKHLHPVMSIWICWNWPLLIHPILPEISLRTSFFNVQKAHLFAKWCVLVLLWNNIPFRSLSAGS